MTPDELSYLISMTSRRALLADRTHASRETAIDVYNPYKLVFDAIKLAKDRGEDIHMVHTMPGVRQYLEMGWSRAAWERSVGILRDAGWLDPTIGEGTHITRERSLSDLFGYVVSKAAPSPAIVDTGLYA